MDKYVIIKTAGEYVKVSVVCKEDPKVLKNNIFEDPSFHEVKNYVTILQKEDFIQVLQTRSKFYERLRRENAFVYSTYLDAPNWDTSVSRLLDEPVIIDVDALPKRKLDLVLNVLSKKYSLSGGYFSEQLMLASGR